MTWRSEFDCFRSNDTKDFDPSGSKDCRDLMFDVIFFWISSEARVNLLSTTSRGSAKRKFEFLRSFDDCPYYYNYKKEK